LILSIGIRAKCSTFEAYPLGVKKMSNPNDQAPPLTEGDPVNNVVGTPPVLPQGGNTHGASTSHQAHGHGDESSDSEDEEFDDATLQEIL
jgi:hypothetical protein